MYLSKIVRMNSIDSNGRMSTNAAIKAFTNIMDSLNTRDRQAFLSFIADNWKAEEAKLKSLSRNYIDDCHKESNLEKEQMRNIKKIIIDIRSRVPFDGILPSEHIVPPTVGENSDCDDTSTKHVDAFLYDSNEVIDLIEEGGLNNLYCTNCGSKNVKEYNIISHSMSVSTMLYIFHSILPSLEGKTLLDIGSRLGAVLFGAHIFTSAQRIIGVEMNKELCALQCEITRKYKMNDRVEIINKRIEECPEILQNSNIIIMNNPFEFYVPQSVHTDIWKYLRCNIQKGTILVTRPSIERIFAALKTGISIKEWVKPYETEKNLKEPVDPDDHADINVYEVL